MILQLNNYILIIVLLLSLYFDLTQKKIPNFLTLPAILWGLITYTIASGLEGLSFSFLGLLLGIAIFFIPFMLGGMGGGDVKLLGAIGAMKGLQFVLHAAIYTVFCGGILAIIYLLCNGQLLRTLKKILSIIAVPLLTVLYFKFKHPFLNQLSLYFSSFADCHVSKKVYLPYGVAIAIGTILVLSGISKSFLIL